MLCKLPECICGRHLFHQVEVLTFFLSWIILIFSLAWWCQQLFHCCKGICGPVAGASPLLRSGSVWAANGTVDNMFFVSQLPRRVNGWNASLLSRPWQVCMKLMDVVIARVGSLSLHSWVHLKFICQDNSELTVTLGSRGRGSHEGSSDRLSGNWSPPEFGEERWSPLSAVCTCAFLLFCLALDALAFLLCQSISNHAETHIMLQMWQMRWAASLYSIVYTTTW